MQKLNTYVFKDPYAVTDNILKATEHLQKKNLKSLVLINSEDNMPYFECEDGFFRMYEFVENAYTCENIDSLDTLYECGFAYGSFITALSDLDAKKIKETIPCFIIRFTDTIILFRPRKMMFAID